MDRENLRQFREVMRRAYAHQKEKGKVKRSDQEKLDKLFDLEQGQRCITRDGRVLFFWRTFRRRAAIKYAQAHGKPLKLQLDWQAIWEWIIDNWELIIRTIIFLVPFII